MSEQEILEGNRLIADFMQVDYSGKEQIMWRPGAYIPFTEKCLRYHSSWDWLMSVVNKIENIGSIVEIHGTRHALEKINLHSCRIHYSIFNTVTDKYVADEIVLFRYNTKFNISKINCVYEAVVEFIKWHNQQNNETNKLYNK